MKDTRIADIRAQSADQLSDRLVELKKEQFNLRFQRAAGQAESTSRVKQVRREIARIKTVQGQPAGSVAMKASAVKATAKSAAGKGKK